jgi:hypothetical protein
MKVLSSNKDLYDYLFFLTSELKQRELIVLAKAVEFAMGNAASSSTEFLGESKIALKQVLSQEKGVLTKQERADLLDVLKQLDAALNKH